MEILARAYHYGDETLACWQDFGMGTRIWYRDKNLVCRWDFGTWMWFWYGGQDFVMCASFWYPNVIWYGDKNLVRKQEFGTQVRFSYTDVISIWKWYINICAHSCSKPSPTYIATFQSKRQSIVICISIIMYIQSSPQQNSTQKILKANRFEM